MRQARAEHAERSSRGTSFIDVGAGVHLYVKDWGAGPPVVFLHGWPLSHRIFEYHMQALAALGSRTVGIDLRGFGASDQPWQGNDLATWAADVRTALEVLNLVDVTLVGFSTGAAVAVLCAASGERRIRRLVLASASVPGAATLDELAVAAMNQLITQEIADPPLAASTYIALAFHRRLSHEYASFIAGIAATASLRARLRMLEEIRDCDLRPELGRIAIPTTIFHGVRDRLVPFRLAEFQQTLIAGSRVVPFFSSGHALFADQRERVTDELLRATGMLPNLAEPFSAPFSEARWWPKRLGV